MVQRALDEIMEANEADHVPSKRNTNACKNKHCKDIFQSSLLRDLNNILGISAGFRTTSWPGFGIE